MARIRKPPPPAVKPPDVADDVWSTCTEEQRRWIIKEQNKIRKLDQQKRKSPFQR